MFWRFESGRLASGYAGENGTPGSSWDMGTAQVPITPERIDLWHSLKHEPYREVPDEGDE